MSYTSACLIVLISVLAAAVGSRLVCGTVRLDTRRRHHEVGGPVFLQLGVMFAVLLAFVFSEVWSEYNEAALAINGECGALHGASILARALPQPQGQAVGRAILIYVTDVAHVEWPAIAHRHASLEAGRSFEAIFTAVAQLDVSRPPDLANQGQILQLLTTAHSFRETRIFQADEGLPPFMWVVLIVYTLILIWFVMLAGTESTTGHVLFASIFVGSTVLVLILIRMLDYPFEGALALNPADFLKTVQRVSHDLSSPLQHS